MKTSTHFKALTLFSNTLYWEMTHTDIPNLVPMRPVINMTNVQKMNKSGRIVDLKDETTLSSVRW
jgi:hypothetical protein